MISLCGNHCTLTIKSEFRCILRGSNQKTKLMRDELVCMSWDLSFVILMLTDGGWQVCLGAVDSMYKREKWSATVCRGCSSRTNVFSFLFLKHFFNITFSFQFKTYQVKTKNQGTLLHNSRQRQTTQSKSSVFTFWCFEEIIWFQSVEASGMILLLFLIKLYLLYWCVFYWLWQHTQTGYCCLCISVPFLLLYSSHILDIHTAMMGFSKQSTEHWDIWNTAELSQTVNWVLFCIRLKNWEKMI